MRSRGFEHNSPAHKQRRLRQPRSPRSSYYHRRCPWNGFQIPTSEALHGHTEDPTALCQGLPECQTVMLRMEHIQSIIKYSHLKIRKIITTMKTRNKCVHQQPSLSGMILWYLAPMANKTTRNNPLPHGRLSTPPFPNPLDSQT